MQYVEVILSKTINLIRDVYQYCFSGAFFLTLWLFTNQMNHLSLDRITRNAGKIISHESVIIFLILCYFIGQILFALSIPITQVFRRVRKLNVEPLIARKRRELLDFASWLYPNAHGSFRPFSSHIHFEMQLFKKEPEIHKKFIERYNNLMNMRQTVATAFFIFPFLALFPLSANVWLNKYYYIIWISSWLISYNFFKLSRTNTLGFLDRILAGYLTIAGDRALIYNYFAYGSNMSKKQMKARCPSSNFLTTGSLVDYSIAFPRYSEKWMGGVAGICPQKGDRTEGILYTLSPSDLLKLDENEGVPDHRYYRKLLQVEAKSKGLVWAWVYFPYKMGKKHYSPSKKYLNTMIDASRENGFSKKYVKRIKRTAKKKI